MFPVLKSIEKGGMSDGNEGTGALCGRAAYSAGGNTIYSHDGGWLFYYREKLIGGIYGDGFAVKDTEASRNFMPDCREEVWENTPKALLPCTILDDSGKLCEMVRAMYPELPEPKEKKPRRKKTK